MPTLGGGGLWLDDNLTKFIWVKNYTKTYKSRKNNRNVRKIRIYTRENCTEKIHEKGGTKSAKYFFFGQDGYISEPHPQHGLTRLAVFAKPTHLHPK
jgi:hypothetical protein